MKNSGIGKNMVLFLNKYTPEKISQKGRLSDDEIREGFWAIDGPLKKFKGMGVQ